MGKGKIHYIEVVSTSEEEIDDEENGVIHNIHMNQREDEWVLHEQGEEVPPHHDAGVKKVPLASISGVPTFNTFQMKGFLQR
jgi:hypothetical protein